MFCQGNLGQRGIARAHYTLGCLLSRGGPVSPRRNRNLGMEQTGARVGPLFICFEPFLNRSPGESFPAPSIRHILLAASGECPARSPSYRREKKKRLGGIASRNAGLR